MLPQSRRRSILQTASTRFTVWDADGNLVDAPEKWKEFRISPRIHVSHVWFMGTNFGPVLRLTDALLRPEEDAPASLKRKSPF